MERQEHNPEKSVLDRKFDLTLSSDTLTIMRSVLERPNVPVSRAKGLIEKHAESIVKRLPMPIIAKEFPVTLNGNEVNFITAHINFKRFDISTPLGQRQTTQYRQAFWELNTAYSNESGILVSNFEGFLKKYNILETS